MGHGLKPNAKGVHVAFAAGTGVLCFTDLVASIAHSCLNICLRRSSINSEQEF